VKVDEADSEEERDGQSYTPPPSPSQWYGNLVNEAMEHDFVGQSTKLALLLSILKHVEERGEKMWVLVLLTSGFHSPCFSLVFTLSLETMDLIERMLRHTARAKWVRGRDYNMIMGKTNSTERANIQRAFNDPANRRLRMLLISTRAGSLGTNLVAASRVVLFDANWNPSHDNQAVFRAYRQQRDVFVYRLISGISMEETVFKRQVNKHATATRVVEGGTPSRHFGRETDLSRC